jgi:beta-N-acetylhexosaminidase
VLLAVAMVALIAGIAVGGGDGDGGSAATQPEVAIGPEPDAVRQLTLRRQVGQMTVSSFDGPTVPPYIRRRLRAGETAGVILFGRNGGPRATWKRVTRTLQRAAGGSALVAVDQEGGGVRTVPFAGPQAAQPDQGTPDEIRSAARAAGRVLRATGVNVNLAPVADVASSSASVMADRAFTGLPVEVSSRVDAAVRGLREGGVAATAKHFPGLGGATANTDDAEVSIGAVPSDLETRDLLPFRAAIAAHVPLVMLSHALYPAIDTAHIASQSPLIATDMLRHRLGFRGVAITDSMEAEAVLARSGVAEAAERSVEAGADLILLTGSASWNDAFPRLLARARRDRSFRERVRRSAMRVLALKRSLHLMAPPER